MYKDVGIAAMTSHGEGKTRVTPVQRMLVVMAVVVLLAPGVSHAVTGSLSTADGGLIGWDGWETDATLSWDITTDDGLVYDYCYHLVVPSKAVSHFIFSATPGEPAFEEGWPDLIDLMGDWKAGDPYLTLDPDDDEVEIDTFVGTGVSKPNPYMPGNIFGVKINLDEDVLDLQWCFKAFRLPVPGDFYAVDGWDQPTQEYAALYNASFGDPDAEEHKVLVPNGRTPELPPSALLALSMMPLGIAYLRGRRRKQS